MKAAEEGELGSLEQGRLQGKGTGVVLDLENNHNKPWFSSFGIDLSQ
jgi:hypothetical protein